MSQPDEDVHREIPRETTERGILLTVSSDGVVDLGNVRCYVRHAGIIKSIDPYSRVPFNYVSIQIMKCSCCMLRRTSLMRKLLFELLNPHPCPTWTKMTRWQYPKSEEATEQQEPSRTTGTNTAGDCLALPRKVSTHIPFTPATPLLSVGLREA